jgi:hypothetical protein
MYAVVCLNGILQTSYLQHLILFVCAVDILNGTSISSADLQLADDLLQYFIEDFERLYGRCNLSYNIHQLGHLTDTVRCWGPLWTTSAFPFESGNGMLMKLFNGTQGLPLQVSRRFTTFRSLPVMAFKYIHSDNIRDFFNNTLSIYAPVNKILRTAENAGLLGKPLPRHLTAGERCALDAKCQFPLPLKALYYTKAIANGYIVSVNKPNGRRNNSCIMCTSGICGILENIVDVCGSIYMLCHQLHLARDFITVAQPRKASTRSIKVVSSVSETLIAVSINDFEHPCIYVDNDNTYQSPLVCLVHYRFDGD